MDLFKYLQQVERSGKQQAIVTLRQYMYTCTHPRTAGKIM